MLRAGPRKVRRYTDEFKLTAVRLSQQPGMQVRTVDAALVDPFPELSTPQLIVALDLVIDDLHQRARCVARDVNALAAIAFREAETAELSFYSALGALEREQEIEPDTDGASVGVDARVVLRVRDRECVGESLES